MLGYTSPVLSVIEDYMTVPAGEERLAVAEFGGRNCYLSFDKPNEATRAQYDYIRNIVRQGHLSVLEHVSVTFYVTGVSRSLLTELSRHRHLSLSVVSQRYVDPSKLGYVIPPALEGDKDYIEVFGEIWQGIMEVCKETFKNLRSLGHSIKRSREASRGIIPSNAETRIVVTGNLRTWREFIQKRMTVHADQEIARLAKEVYAILINQYPAVFIDLPAFRE